MVGISSNSCPLTARSVPSRLLLKSEYSTMSPVLPFDVIAVIIDIVGENKDTDLLKELALVSHSFHHICIKQLFANIDLHDADPFYHLVSSKNGFVQLVKSRPDIVNYIRKLTYKVSAGDNREDDHLLSPILSNFLPTTSCLNCLEINASGWEWNALDSSLTSAFLHLISLPTINHIDLSFIQNFPLSSLTSSVNLLRLDMRYLHDIEEDNYSKNVQSEMLPKIREFHTSNSCWPTMKLLDIKGQDGRPVFNFMDLRQLSVTFFDFEDIRNIQCLLEKAKLLERLHLSVISFRLSLVGVLSTASRTLKVLYLTVPIYQYLPPPLAGLCEELESMAGHNTLEVLSFEVVVDSRQSFDSVGSRIQEVENVLVKPGWAALRQVSFKLAVRDGEGCKELTEALQSLPDKYFSRLSKLEPVAFSYSAYSFSYLAYSSA